jgi:hypothetical protein
MSPQPASESGGMGEILAPLLHITPELNELCGDPPMVVVSTTPSPPPSEPCQTLAHVDSGGLDASDSLPSMDIGHVVSLSDEIAEIGVLAPNSEALFRKELSDLLVILEAVSPGYGMEITCVLAGKASEDMIKKVEKSLRSKKKKRVVSWKFPRPLN